jgi:divalent metal cation (Fe/Co/Zn/Cd) transporter
VTIGTAAAEEARSRLARRARLLAGASVAYNAAEGVIAIAAGTAASSIALIGFGMDSVVEMGSGLVILWQFAHRVPERRERQALRLIGACFLLLAAYVGVESARGLLVGPTAAASTVGIALAVASLLVMPALAYAKQRTGRALGSPTVGADAMQTWLCTGLSAVLLVGLGLNAALGWWWADPLAGLIIAAVAAREGVRAWRGEACECAPVPTRSACDCDDEACRGADECC